MHIDPIVDIESNNTTVFLDILGNTYFNFFIQPSHLLPLRPPSSPPSLILPPSPGGRRAVALTKPLALCSCPAGALGFQPVNIPASVLALPRLS